MYILTNMRQKRSAKDFKQQKEKIITEINILQATSESDMEPQVETKTTSLEKEYDGEDKTVQVENKEEIAITKTAKAINKI